MARVSRLILISNEIGPADIALIRDRLPRQEDFSTFCVWTYDKNNAESKWVHFEQAMLSLQAFMESEGT